MGKIERIAVPGEDSPITAAAAALHAIGGSSPAYVQAATTK